MDLRGQQISTTTTTSPASAATLGLALEFDASRLRNHDRLAAAASWVQFEPSLLSLAALSEYQRLASSLAEQPTEPTGASNAADFNQSHLESLDEEQIAAVLDEMAKNNNFTSYKDFYGRQEFGQWWWRMVLVALIVLLGVVGNSCVIYSIAKLKRSRSKPTNTFILNMAIADLITCAFCPTIALVKMIHQFYVLGPFMCRFEGFLKITSLFVSSSALIVLSVDWFLAVVKPCRKRISIGGAWLALGVIWVVSILMGSVLSYLRGLRTRQWLDGVVEVWCKEPIERTVIRVYWIIINLMLIYMPTLCIALVLLRILVKIDTYEAKLRKSFQNQMGSLTINMTYRRRIVKTLILYLGTSLICWTPMQVTIIYRHMRTSPEFKSWFVDLTFFSELSVALSSAMNPIIFGFLSRPYRQLMGRLWLTKIVPCIRFNSSSNTSPQPNGNPKNQNISLRPMNGGNKQHLQQQQQLRTTTSLSRRQMTNLSVSTRFNSSNKQPTSRHSVRSRTSSHPRQPEVASKRVSFKPAAQAELDEADRQPRVAARVDQTKISAAEQPNQRRPSQASQLRPNQPSEASGLSRPTSIISMVSVNIEEGISTD